MSFSSVLVYYRRTVIITANALVLVAAYVLAFALRFDFAVPPAQMAVLWQTLPLLLAVRLIVFTAYGLYRGIWKHVGVRDLANLGKAVTLSTFIFAAFLSAIGLLGAVPRTVLALDWMAAILLAGGVRFAARFVHERHRAEAGPARRRALVIGAGEAAERLLRQLQHANGSDLQAIALVDDDPAKLHMTIHDVRVRGTIDQIPELAASLSPDVLVIAIPSATPEQMRRIVDRCLRSRREFKRMPSLRELLEGRATAAELRAVEIEQLLAREPVVFDLGIVREEVEGTVVLITGGAGSVGSELARQILQAKPARLVLFEQAETPLYYIDLELREKASDVEIVAVVGDITNDDHLRRVFATFQPDHVFHAAAYKHVPMMEENPVEAVRNNVLGTLSVAHCAARFGARRFVLISTDKAVHPTSVMGATKRVAERVVLGLPALRNSPTDFRTVRFGNVLGSDGSVVQLFRRQLAAGGPITVTDPEVKRYFMTLPEAAQLVLQAAVLPEAAKRITMLDMGEPVRILELAENLIRLCGMEPYRDINIVFTGLRPGEKLSEALVTSSEVVVPTAIEKIKLVSTDDAGGSSLQEGVAQLAAAVDAGNRRLVIDTLRAMVPESGLRPAASEPLAIHPRSSRRREVVVPMPTQREARLGA
ncbi:MAG TPA: nucleoside-diphosphate sugar epimerase/dehydratase [Gemmatimonadaceae bacterium]|nr:nucleoside-diphosphate sugar epimerase/dehydratase [Gemmatimonadaceae bacterium]